MKKIELLFLLFLALSVNGQVKECFHYRPKLN